MCYTFKIKTGDAIASSVLKITKKVTIIFIILNFLTACKTNSTFKTMPKTKEQILQYYKENNISSNLILFAKNLKSYEELASLGLTTIPEVLIFDIKGKRIKYKVDEKCQTVTNKYLKNIENETDSNYYVNQNLEGYLSYFSLTNTLSIFEENKLKKIMFINSATTTHMLNTYNFTLKDIVNLEKIKILYINLDIQEKWNTKQIPR